MPHHPRAGNRAATASTLRGRAWRTLAAAPPFAAIGLFVALVVLPGMLGLQLFAAGDLITSRAPWVEAYGSPEITNQCVTDTIDSVLPSLLSARDRVRDGDLVPLWEDAASAGGTLVATPAQGLTSPLALLAQLAPDRAVTAWIKALELTAIVLGMVLWARRLGLTAGAGALGALVFASSGFMVMWTNWPQTRTAAMFPLVFWAVERLLQDRTWSSAATFALAVAAMVLGGFPAIAVHAVYFAAAYAVVRWFALRPSRAAEERGSITRPVALLTAGGLAAVALTAFQLVPWAGALAAVDLSYRGELWREVVPLGSLLTTAFPLAQGTCGTQVPPWALNPVETNSYVGAAALVLCLAALTSTPPPRARGARLFFASCAGFAFVVSFVGGPVNYLFQLLPLVGNNSLHRVRAVGALMIAMLAAIGYDALRRSWPRGRARRALAWGALVLGLAVVAALALRTRATAPISEAWLAVRPSLVLGVLAATVTAGLWAAVLLVRNRRTGRLVSWLVTALVPVLVLLEALTITGAFWPRTAPDTLYPPTDTTEFLQRNLGHDRFVGHDKAYWRGAGRVDGLRSLDGHEFVTPGWEGLIRSADPGFFITATSTTLSSLDHMGSPVLDRLATRYVVADLVGPVSGNLDAGSGWTRETVPLQEHVARRAVDGDDRLRALVIHVPSLPERVEGARLVATISDEAGGVVATAARRLRVDDDGLVFVPIAAERLGPGRELQAEVSVTGTDALGVSVTQAGTPWLGVVVARPEDRTVLVRTSDSQVYERPDALERFRWASAAEPCGSAPECAAKMAGLPPSTVLLDPQVVVDLDGRPARLSIELDEDDLKRVRVAAQGAGILVLADALQDGWVARVDGTPATVHRADGALMGVAVPAGTHVVELGYEPVGWDVLPAVAVVVLVGICGVLVRERLGRLPTRPGPHRRRR